MKSACNPLDVWPDLFPCRSAISHTLYCKANGSFFSCQANLPLFQAEFRLPSIGKSPDWSISQDVEARNRTAIAAVRREVMSEFPWTERLPGPFYLPASFLAVR